LKSAVNAVAMLLLSLCAFSRAVHAQEVSGYFGMGGAHASSSGAQIDTFGDGTLHGTPGLGGFWGTVGGNIFFTKHLGFGAEASWKIQSDYAGIQYRPSFYNFDAIFRPARTTTKRWAPEFRAGLGGAHINYFPDDPSFCDQIAGCPSSRHFQVHLGVSAPWYVTKHVYLRPAVDVHYVRNLFEFGSDWVPEYSVGIGYSFGRE
jgi:hypothetical protein